MCEAEVNGTRLLAGLTIRTPTPVADESGRYSSVVDARTMISMICGADPDIPPESSASHKETRKSSKLEIIICLKLRPDSSSACVLTRVRSDTSGAKCQKPSIFMSRIWIQ